MKKSGGFTLIELILVVVILLILASIALPNFVKAKSKTEQREAIANLQLIAAEEKMYYADFADYMDCACTSPATCAAASGCNALLKLMLNPQNWNYTVTASGGAGARSANITAKAKSGGCIYTLLSNDFNNKTFSTATGCIE
jgi:prepilin-type N-terminal cleavage/methylation domain-containing protein